jgi:hypothetical protein
MKSKHTAQTEPTPTPLLGQDEPVVDIFRGDEIIPDTNNRFVRECDYREVISSLAAAQKELQSLREQESAAWIDVKRELPPANVNHCWLAWITSQNKNGGYIDLVSYGDYVCQNDDIRPGDPAYTEDSDDGNMRGTGWYREEETHGGEFDYIFVNLNGKVTHWMPLPSAPTKLEQEKP